MSIKFAALTYLTHHALRAVRSKMSKLLIWVDFIAALFLFYKLKEFSKNLYYFCLYEILYIFNVSYAIDKV